MVWRPGIHRLSQLHVVFQQIWSTGHPTGMRVQADSRAGFRHLLRHQTILGGRTDQKMPLLAKLEIRVHVGFRRSNLQ